VLASLAQPFLGLLVAIREFPFDPRNVVQVRLCNGFSAGEFLPICGRGLAGKLARFWRGWKFFAI
jgi:hypothetical protein